MKRQLAENRAAADVFTQFEQTASCRSELIDVPVDTSHNLRKFLDAENADPVPASENPAPVPNISLNPFAEPFDTIQQFPNHDATLVTNSSPIQHNTPQDGWTKIASSLERVITQLAEKSIQQGEVNKRLAVSSQLPKINVPVFVGEPLHYPLWQNAFNALIDSKPLDVDTKLNYLNQYVAGKPRQVVEHYMLIGTEEAYQKARDVLADRYGNTSVISCAFTTKLEKWSRIPPRDAVALRDFSDFLDKVSAARLTIPSLGILDFPKENAKLVEKLPHHLDSKWRESIERWRFKEGPGTYPPFSEFASFVRRAADRANMPELKAITRSKDPPSRLARRVPPAGHQRVRVPRLSLRKQPTVNVPLVSHPRVLQAHVCFVMAIITLRNANHSGGNTTRTERRSSSRDGYVWAVRPVTSIKLESVRNDVNVKHVLVVT
ncbi:uncharacterized protein [Asterias amurensis]|uniref:uncharacterized protein n=1 Tax=Asterias amurensis TaxID=7602 RepID=UPI003AB71496